jgi:predicted amidohydrolase
MKRAGAVILLVCGAAHAQVYDLLLKNGHVIDPANHRNGRFDVAISGDKIARVAPGVPAAHARVVIEAGDYTIAPGLIDIDAHFNAAAQGRNLEPDYNSLPYGVTTAVDAGDSTPKDFEEFKRRVIDRSKTRVLAFLDPSGDDAGAATMIGRYPRILVGKRIDRRALVFRDAALAIKQRQLPEIIDTGLDSENVLLQRANMMTTASKYLNLGMTLDQIVERTTMNPAREIHRTDLGTLSEGAVADIAMIETQSGKFGFVDAANTRLEGDRRLRCVLTIRNGKVVWDSEGLAAPDWIQAGPYSNYK